MAVTSRLISIVLLLVYRRDDSKDDNKKEHFVTGSACVPKWSIRKGADRDATFIKARFQKGNADIAPSSCGRYRQW
ncbi:hypothetical protein [Caballeronia fortuita]|uniref:hypothetical protein n=1 Tax=Caballeronia fortuita TaxID=1777138 RepID=UPI000A81FA7E|nr:hypothetical protein [Caballeronia fortuita]